MLLLPGRRSLPNIAERMSATHHSSRTEAWFPAARALARLPASLAPRALLVVFAVSSLLSVLPGCGQKSETGGGEAAKPKDANAPLGNLVEPFTPPTLAELDAKAEWIDQPVEDSIELLRAYQARHKPLTTLEEALRLKNDSPGTNEKIVSALGRLPESDSEVDWDATINRHLRSDLKSTNPIMISSTSEFEIDDLTGFKMFGFDWTFRKFALKETVVSWQSSKDGLCDKVVLRDDLNWSDGEPITAHDVAFTFRAIMDDRVPVPAMRSGTDKVRWVEAYDDRTVVFFHKEALSTNSENVDFNIIPQHLYEKSIRDDYSLQSSEQHVKYENNPVCGGPYKIVSRSRGQEIVLERRESWYMHDGKQVRTKPYFKTVRFRVIEDSNTTLLALKTGSIDESLLTAEQWVTQTSGEDFYALDTKASAVEWVYFYFGWNLKQTVPDDEDPKKDKLVDSPFFSDVRVRKAMSYAFDYDELMDKLWYGLYQPSVGIFYPNAWMAPKPPPAPYKQDLAKAEELLDAAGWIDHDGDGIRDKLIDGKYVKFKFSILCPNSPEPVAICNLLKENLDQIGVLCNVRPMEFTVLQEQTLKHRFQAFLGGWGTGTDPDTVENIWGTKQDRNFVCYSNPEVDQLFERGRKEFDRQKRAAIYARIHEIIYAEQPYTFLYVRNAFYGFNKQLRGYNFSPRGPYSYMPGFFSIWRVAK